MSPPLPEGKHLLYADGTASNDFPKTDAMQFLPGNAPIAVGGDLQPARLLQAYQHGVFPWFENDRQILWWSPDPRCVLWPQNYHLPKRLKRRLHEFEMQAKGDFEEVITACAAPRGNDNGTWITPGMIQAYTTLHQLGYAEAIAIYAKGKLAGGVYGVRLGQVFFGESMFSRVSGASRVALAYLLGTIDSDLPPCRLLDCQNPTAHLQALGACVISRRNFIHHLQFYCSQQGNQSK